MGVPLGFPEFTYFYILSFDKKLRLHSLVRLAAPAPAHRLVFFKRTNIFINPFKDNLQQLFVVITYVYQAIWHLSAVCVDRAYSNIRLIKLT